MITNTVKILKASGETAPFSEEKLAKSLKRSGASEDAIQDVVREVKTQLYEGMPTWKIYKLAFQLIKAHSKHAASKYKLKQAIMELGPSGYPFEKYIGEILRYRGFTVRVDEVVAGHCVNHEIDVIAEKGDRRFMIECKYHNSNGIICDVKIPLYIQARFEDVRSGPQAATQSEYKFHQGWLVTNTKFSKDAVQYGTCMGLNLIGWNYPESGNLRDQIDHSGLYPLTCLFSLTRTEKQRLIDNKIVLCREIIDKQELLASAGISPTRIPIIVREAMALCPANQMKEDNLAGLDTTKPNTMK